MSTESRRKSIPVSRILAERPYEFSFKQAVRLLARATAFKTVSAEKQFYKPVARYMPPASEFIRFNVRQSFSFPSAEIEAVKQTSNGANISQWKMDVNFMGLTGTSGILPFHYTETALQRLKLKDNAMIDFLNLFNHRIISLFYQSSCKYNLPIEYERNRLESPNNHVTDNYTQTLLSLMGFGTKNLRNRLYTKDESLACYTGLFTENVRSASSLKQILQNHFSIPVEIQDFIGQWQDLIDDVRTRLSSESSAAQNNCLGKTAMLGKKGWYVQGKVRIILGPLNKSQLQTFSPGTNTLKALNEIVRLYIGLEHDYDFIMRIRKKDIPQRVSLSANQPAVAGWNTWLSSKSRNLSYSDETIDIPVSCKRFN